MRIGLTDLPKTGGGIAPLFPASLHHYELLYIKAICSDEFNWKFLSHADSENVLHGRARPTNFQAKT